MLLHCFHLFLELGHFFEEFEVGLFLSHDDGVAAFEFGLSNFEVFVRVSWSGAAPVGAADSFLVRLGRPTADVYGFDKVPRRSLAPDEGAVRQHDIEGGRARGAG